MPQGRGPGKHGACICSQLLPIVQRSRSCWSRMWISRLSKRPYREGTWGIDQGFDKQRQTTTSRSSPSLRGGYERWVYCVKLIRQTSFAWQSNTWTPHGKATTWIRVPGGIEANGSLCCFRPCSKAGDCLSPLRLCNNHCSMESPRSEDAFETIFSTCVIFRFQIRP